MLNLDTYVNVKIAIYLNGGLLAATIFLSVSFTKLTQLLIDNFSYLSEAYVI